MSGTAQTQFSPQTKPMLEFDLTTNTDDNMPVFIAGNFNDWKVNDERFQMKRIANGHFQLHLAWDEKMPNSLEYKYLRNGWENVELDQYGCHTANRVIEKKDGIVRDNVNRWRNNGLEYKPQLLPKGKIITNEFEIPQLGKKRRVSILLPHDYDSTNKFYPVLYLQDGQNLFNDYSPYGTWSVDKRMAVLQERGQGDVIIVAIDHGGVERIQEFIPYENTKFGATDGKKYARFMVETLKPFIDKNYRTLPEREHTGIGGSSLGALISIYAALMYPSVYSKMMIFSPSLWVSSKIFFDAIGFSTPFSTKIYVYAGGQEGSGMIPNVQRFKDAIAKRGMDASKIDFKLSIDPQGVHNEERWGKEYPKALEWLYF
jgi:predicted alpha/beta superfamily hydrolase